MKRKHGVFFGFAVLIIAAIFIVASCDSGTNSSNFIPVTNITNLPEIALLETGLSLSGTIEPADATNKTITWSGDDVTNGVFNASSTGESTVTATIANGSSESSPYTKTFIIDVWPISTTPAEGTWINGQKTFVITGNTWQINGVYGPPGANVPWAKGIVVAIESSSTAKVQVTSVYLADLQWHTMYLYQTGTWSFTNGGNTWVLTATGNSREEINGTWTKQQ
jgi:hypothetical protein